MYHQKKVDGWALTGNTDAEGVIEQEAKNIHVGMKPPPKLTDKDREVIRGLARSSFPGGVPIGGA